MRLSGLVFGRWCREDPRTNASVDVATAGGVAAGGGTEAVAAGADEVALVSGTGTAADV